MDFKVAVDYDIRLKEKTRGYITKEQNILTLGPFQSDGFRLSFCTKRQIGTRDTISDKEWPRGSYSIFARESHKCPEGKRKEYLSQLMRLWHFLSFVNSFFKRAYAAI